MNTEDRFTGPSKLCPHPGRWHSTDSDSTEVEVTALVASFVTALQPDLVVETGTAWGQTAEAIGHALQANGQGHLVTFETDPERVAYSGKRCAGLPVQVAPESSLVGLDKLSSNTVGFAFLDSLFDLRVKELVAIEPLLTPRAVVGVHDTADHHPLWSMLVTAGLGDRWRFLRLPTPRGVAFLQSRAR